MTVKKSQKNKIGSEKREEEIKKYCKPLKKKRNAVQSKNL